MSKEKRPEDPVEEKRREDPAQKLLLDAVILKVLQEEHQRLNRQSQPVSQTEVVSENPSLTRFKADYDVWSEEDKQRCPWEEVQRRLLKDDGRQLSRAIVMQWGGILFGVDNQGNPLIADGGYEPIMRGANYPDTRKAVMFREDEKGEQVPTGYEMFPCRGLGLKSKEIIAFERFTESPFIGAHIMDSRSKQEWRSSWLESGECPDFPHVINLEPLVDPDIADVDIVAFYVHKSGRGVRRLLRL